MRIAGAAAVLAGALLVAGCGSEPAPAGGEPLLAPVTTTPAPPATTTPAVPKPANGTDLAACVDADCEVEVRAGQEIPLDGKHGVDQLLADTVTKDDVKIKGFGPGTELSLGFGAPHDGAQSKMNNVRIGVLYSDATRAIIRISAS